MKKKNDLGYLVSSGNVFADLGLRNPEVLLAKADLVFEISRSIEARGLTQAEAADLLGIDQPKISALVRGRLSGFSMERLYRYLNALGKDIEIVVKPAPRNEASRKPLRVVRVDAKVGTATRVASRRRSVAAKRGRSSE